MPNVFEITTENAYLCVYVFVCMHCMCLNVQQTSLCYRDGKIPSVHRQKKLTKS